MMALPRRPGLGPQLSAWPRTARSTPTRCAPRRPSPPSSWCADGSLHARANKSGDELRRASPRRDEAAGVPGTCFGEASIFHVSFEGKPGLAGFDRPRKRATLPAAALRPAQQRRGLRRHHGWISAVHDEADLQRTVQGYERAFSALAADGAFKGM